MLRSTSNFLVLGFFFWAGLISLSYVDNFAFIGAYKDLVFDELFSLLALILLSLLSGNKLLRFLPHDDESTLEEALFSSGLGMGLLSVAIFILGLFRLLYPSTLALLLIGFLIAAGCNYGYLTSLCKKMWNWQPSFSSAEVLLLFMIGGFVGLTLMNTLTPPIARDALIHHLAIPKKYVMEHRIVDVPFSAPSYFPPLMEMLYAGALLLSSDIFAQLVHFVFYIGSLFFTYVLSRHFLSRPMSLLASLLFGSLPVVCQVASLAYSDLGLTFFTLAGLRAVLEWQRTGSNGWLGLAALMSGLAASCKYNGLIVLFSLLVIVLIVLNRWQVPLRQFLRAVAFFLSLAILVNVFWLGKNYVFAGNPVYPIGKKYAGKEWLPDQDKLSQYQERTLLWGETLWDQLALPWNLSIQTTSKAHYELDGVINPIFLVFLPFFIFFCPKTRSLQYTAGFCLLYFLFFWASSRVRLRYLLPIYPLLGIITACTLNEWRTKGRKFLVVFTVVCSFILNLYWLLTYTSFLNPFGFLVGKETRTAFLNRHIPSYPVFDYANKSLPPNARIMLLYGGSYGNDVYYLDCDYFFDSRYLGYTWKRILKQSATPENVREKLSKMGISHLLINWRRLVVDFESSLSTDKLLLFRKFCGRYLQLECKHGGSYLYRIL